MDIQMATVNTVSSIGRPVGNQASEVSGKSAAPSGGEGTFTQVLEGQILQDSSIEPTDAAMSLAGLMQMLQSLPLIQTVIQGQGEQQEGDRLPEVLLQAMNSNPGFAESLLLDPRLQQWFTQAGDLLHALSGKEGSSPNVLGVPTQPQNGLQNLQAQNTLLLLTSMLQKQPNNQLLQHLAQDLQGVLQPLMPQISKELNADSSLGFTAVDKNPSNNINTVEFVGSQQKETKTSGLQSAHKRANDKHSLEILVGQAQVQTVSSDQFPKSKLELLAARTAVQMPTIMTQSAAVAPVEVQEQPEAELSSGISSIPIAEIVKTPFQLENNFKAAPAPISAANFAQEMSQHVLKNMKITLTEGISEAKLSLFPKNLGHVDVKISMHEGQLIAQFAADSLAGKQMLESQLPQLRQALQNQGLQVEKLEVTQSPNMHSGMFQEQRHHQHSSKQAARTNHADAVSYDQESIDFVQELSGTAQSRKAVYGNSFDVTA